MSAISHSILTVKGKEELLRAFNTNNKAVWNKVVVGSGDIESIEHKELMTELVNQEWEGEITDSTIINNEVLALKIVLDSKVGGFEITEIGLKNSLGDLVVVASCDLGYKRSLNDSDGYDEIELYLRIKLNDVALVEIQCDESNVYVTKEGLDQTVTKAIDDKFDQSERLKQIEENKLQIEKNTKEIEKIYSEYIDVDLTELNKRMQNTENEISKIIDILDGLTEFLEEYI